MPWALRMLPTVASEMWLRWFRPQLPFERLSDFEEIVFQSGWCERDQHLRNLVRLVFESELRKIRSPFSS